MKHRCVSRADSVRHITLLGILSGVKDTTEAMRLAFGPIYAALSACNRTHTRMSTSSHKWRPAFPALGKWGLVGEEQLPTEIVRKK